MPAPGSKATTRRPSSYPRKVEDDYARVLRGRVDLVARLLLQQLRPLLASARERELARGDCMDWSPSWRADAWYLGGRVLPATMAPADLLGRMRVDSVAIWLRDFLQLLTQLRGALVTVMPASPDLAERYGLGVEANATKVLQRLLGRDVVTSGLGTVRQAQLKVWSRENADLVTDLQTRYLDDIANQVAAAVQKGTSTRDLTRLITQRTKIAKRRASLIARDQVATLNAKVNAARHRELGIDEFIWRSSEDERVRALHVEINGKRYRYSLGGHPTEGLPGQPINCRCTAEPVIPGISGISAAA